MLWQIWSLTVSARNTICPVYFVGPGIFASTYSYLLRLPSKFIDNLLDGYLNRCHIAVAFNIEPEVTG
ncbi:MAG: hypothetical protein LBE04_05135 [Prevotellaceae bacterium]|nr:hypothetical protein [Prevotellaceae bacterium]